jgi:outer membrane protein assembly factor BamB
VAAGDPHLYAVNAQTGRQLWQLDTGDWLASGPVIADGVVYLAGKDGTVMAWNITSNE